MTSLRRNGNTHIPKWTTVSIDGRLKGRRGCESGCYFSVTFDLVWFDLNATRHQYAVLVIDRVPAVADCQIHHVRIDFVQIIKPINGTDWILDRVTCELFTMNFHQTCCDEIRNWNSTWHQTKNHFHFRSQSFQVKRTYGIPYLWCALLFPTVIGFNKWKCTVHTCKLKSFANTITNEWLTRPFYPHVLHRARVSSGRDCENSPKIQQKWSTYCWLLCDKVLHYSSWAFNGGCYDTFTWYMNMILALEMHFHLSSVNLLCIRWRITLLRVSTYVLRMKPLPNKALPFVPRTKRHEHLAQIKIVEYIVIARALRIKCTFWRHINYIIPACKRHRTQTHRRQTNCQLCQRERVTQRKVRTINCIICRRESLGWRCVSVCVLSLRLIPIWIRFWLFGVASIPAINLFYDFLTRTQ